MKKLTKHTRVAPLLGVTGLALLAWSASAQVIQYNTGDLILDFSESGYSDLEVDIGSLATLTSEAQNAGGTYQIGGNAYNISSQLLGNFGGSASGVSFAVIGAAGVTGAPDYLSLKRSNPAVENSIPNGWTASHGNAILSQILGVANGLTTYSGNNPADPVGNTATAVLVPSSSSQSAQYVDSFTYHRSGLTGQTGVNLINTLSGSSAVSDLFTYPESSSTPATFDGYFTFDTDGSLNFSIAAVPEPTTYGLFAGAGLLVFSLRNQFKRRTI
jgi:uncharacterized membrane protein YuzA (DUF378 family)